MLQAQESFYSKDIMKNRSGCRYEQLEDLKARVNYADLVGDKNAKSPLDASLNEVWLLHGTRPDNALAIAAEDWDLQLAGTGAGDAFGKGIYFAEDAIKSDEYTEEAPSGHEFAGLRPLLLCRVILGRCLVTEDSAHDVKQDMQLIYQSKFDSLLADRKAAVGTYREFVIYDQNQANVEFILWYKRVFDTR